MPGLSYTVIGQFMIDFLFFNTHGWPFSKPLSHRCYDCQAVHSDMLHVLQIYHKNLTYKQMIPCHEPKHMTGEFGKSILHKFGWNLKAP